MTEVILSPFLLFVFWGKINVIERTLAVIFLQTLKFFPIPYYRPAISQAISANEICFDQRRPIILQSIVMFWNARQELNKLRVLQQQQIKIEVDVSLDHINTWQKEWLQINREAFAYVGQRRGKADFLLSLLPCLPPTCPLFLLFSLSSISHFSKIF